ncbi:hypothetical protein ABZ807_05615 [Micromonospora sp. NPDC047548]|uniref:hypothetical protein n=1 Tax=Micromonospora sp. NPDC047548 TaxID=3155624 RepID=UPI0033C96865
MPAQYAITVVAALVTGFIVGAITVAVAARQRQLDEQITTSKAFRDLLTLAERYASPEHRAALLRGAANLWDVFDPLARELAAALAAPPRTSTDETSQRRRLATGGPIARPAPVRLDVPADMPLIRPRASDE